MTETRRRSATNLQRLDLPILRRHLLSPSTLGLSKRLETRLELINLPPSRIKLLAHLGQFLGVFSFDVLRALVKVELNLTEGFQARDEVVVEDAKVGEWLRFCGAILLLRYKKTLSRPIDCPKHDTYRRLVNPQNLIHILIDCEQKRVPLRQLISILRLG